MMMWINGWGELKALRFRGKHIKELRSRILGSLSLWILNSPRIMVRIELHKAIINQQLKFSRIVGGRVYSL